MLVFLVLVQSREKYTWVIMDKAGLVLRSRAGHELYVPLQLDEVCLQISWAIDCWRIVLLHSFAAKDTWMLYMLINWYMDPGMSMVARFVCLDNKKLKMLEGECVH
jgi:hypothetical protein